MTSGHNVEIVWDELMDAFTSNRDNLVYFLDKNTGEIFFVPSNLEDEELWRQVETNPERFLEIPAFDMSVQRQIMSSFTAATEDPDLKRILCNSKPGTQLYGNLEEILSFFPEEHDRFLEINDEFFSSRVKQWLELNNLFTLEIESIRIPRA
jgi:hypothetical protein